MLARCVDTTEKHALRESFGPHLLTVDELPPLEHVPVALAQDATGFHLRLRHVNVEPVGGHEHVNGGGQKTVRDCGSKHEREKDTITNSGDVYQGSSASGVCAGGVIRKGAHGLKDMKILWSKTTADAP